METSDQAISFQMPAVIKASMEDGRRMVTVEASNEAVDTEGDVILQKGLIASAKSFIADGHLDIDHYSEIGPRIGITNPEWYIVGRPTEVYDGGNNRTFVKGELRKASDGSFDPTRPYDMLWEGLTSSPPVVWYASIYGYPYRDATEDFTHSNEQGGPQAKGATRYLIKGINWTSLAFTRKPVNQALKGNARIVSAKALIKSIQDERNCHEGGHLYEPEPAVSPQPIANSYGIPGELALSHVTSAYDCMKCGDFLKMAGSLPAWRMHFAKCCGMPPGVSDVLAHAGMHKSLILGYY